VKRFSSGMNARLGFAIASSLDPDVLIIDEVLSVGDSRFQERCMTRMRELRKRGVPLVFVSHNLPSVMELCTKALLMNRGRPVYSGDTGDVLQRYRQVASGQAEAGPKTNQDIWITSVQVLDGNGARTERVASSGKMTVRVGYEAARPVERPSFAVDIIRADGVYCFGIGMWSDGHEIGTVSGQGFVDLDIAPLQLTGGFYNVSVGIHRPGGIGPLGGIAMYDLREFAYPFTVTTERGDLGVVCLNHAWRHQAAGEAPAPDPAPGRRAAAAPATPVRTIRAMKEVTVS
jgi:hypothetical protein